MSAFGKIISWLQLLSLPHIQGIETLEKLSRSREGMSLSGLRLVRVGTKSVLTLETALRVWLPWERMGSDSRNHGHSTLFLHKGNLALEEQGVSKHGEGVTKSNAAFKFAVQHSQVLLSSAFSPRPLKILKFPAACEFPPLSLPL